MIYVYCHRPSASANALRNALRDEGVRARRLYGITPPRVPQPVINWGCSDVRYLDHYSKIINPPAAVLKATRKLVSLPILREADIPCVRVTTDVAQANKWVAGGHKVLRRRDGLSNGRGILVWDAADHQHDGQGRFDFWARVFPKTHEFRVAVVGDTVVDVVQKKAASDKDTRSRLIRTHENGWIFAHEGLVLQDQKDLDSLGKLAIDAVAALGLDFGAVDILAKVTPGEPRRLSRAVVCEVNTAPGLENKRTIKAYGEGIKGYIQQL